MPDSSAIIGKIAVKVIPDTDKFKDDLKDQLTKIERQLKAENYSVKIPVELDATAMKEDAKKIREEAKKALKDITLRVNIEDQESLQANIARIQAELKKLDEKQIKIKLNRDDLTKQLEEWQAKLEEIKTIKLQVDPKSLSSVEKAIKKIDAELAALSEETIEIKLDEAHLKHARDQFQAILDDAAQKAQAAADKALQDSIKRSALTVKEVNAALNDIKFAPGVDEAKLEATKREIEAALFKIEDLKAKIDVELDPLAKRKLELEMAALRAKIHDETVKLQVEVDKKNAAEVEATMKLLSRNRKAVVEVVTKVRDSKSLNGLTEALSRLSGFRDGHVFVQDLKEMLFNLDLAIPKIGAVATGIGGIGAAALSGSAYLFALSASLASIGAGALALPGILGGFAIGLIATGVVLKDFNKQFSQLRVGLGRKLTAGSWWVQLQDQMSSNFWTVAKQPIQDLVYTLFPLLEAGLLKTSNALGGWFSGLATGLKDALGPRMAGMFADLNRSINIATDGTGALATSIGILGTLGASYLPRLAEWFVKIANATANWLTEAEKTGKLKNLVDHAIVELKALWTVLVDVVSILADISRAAQKGLGGDALQQLAKGLNRVHAVTKSADFQKTLVDVFIAANNAVKAFTGLVSGPLKTALNNLADLAKSSFRDIGATLGELGAGILTAFNNPRLQSAIESFFNTLRDFATFLRPAWDSVGEAIGAVLDLIDAFINTASPGVARAIENLAGWISTLADGLKPLVEGLGGALNDALDAVAPGITKIVDAIARFSKGDGGSAIIGFFSDLRPLIADIGDWLGKAAEQLAAWGDKNMPKIRENLQPVIEWLRDFLKNDGQKMIDILKGVGDAVVAMSGALGDLMPIIGPLVEVGGLMLLTKRIKDYGDAVAVAVKKIPKGGLLVGLGLAAIFAIDQSDKDAGGLEGILGWIKEIGSFDWSGASDSKQRGEDIKNWWHGIWEWVKDDTSVFRDWWSTEFWPGVEDAFTGFSDWFTSGWGTLFSQMGTDLGNFKDWFVNGWKQMWQALLDEWSGWITGAREKWDAIYATVKDALTGFVSWFVNGWKQMWQALKDEWSGWISEAKAKWDAIWQPVKDGFIAFKNWFVGGWQQMWAGLKSELGTAKDWIVEKWNGMINWFQDLPTKIKNTLTGAKDWLKQAALDVMNGFLEWLNSKWQAVKDFFGKLTNMIPDWKGPRSRDKTLLQDAGTMIMDGFINGLESRYDAVRDSLKGLTDDISGTDMGTISAPNVSGVSGRLASAANGAYANGTTNNRTLIYNAAPGSSISAEEDLFAAGNRARMGW